MNLIETTELTVVAEGRRLIDEVSLAVRAGTWTTVVGPNGSGKTTLVESIAGVRAATGLATIDSHRVREMRERDRAKLVAFVPQHPIMPAGMGVASYVGLGRTAHQGLFQAVTPGGLGVVTELMERLDLTSMRHRDVSTLSGGERQRCVIARALAQETRVIILDEPTTGLDVRHQVETLELLRREVDDHGVTVLATLHDLTLAGLFGDRLALLSGGRLILEGPASAVLRSPELSVAYETPLRVIEVDGVDVVVPTITSAHLARPLER